MIYKRNLLWNKLCCLDKPRLYNVCFIKLNVGKVAIYWIKFCRVKFMWRVFSVLYFFCYCTLIYTFSLFWVWCMRLLLTLDRNPFSVLNTRKLFSVLYCKTPSLFSTISACFYKKRRIISSFFKTSLFCVYFPKLFSFCTHSHTFEWSVF